MNKIIAKLILALMLCGACDNERPNPSLTNNGDASFLDVPDVTITQNANGYICYCALSIPLNCVVGCGTVGTGTTVNEQTGYCEIGTRPLNICLPNSLNPSTQNRTETTHIATIAEIEQDCRTRIQTHIRESTRYYFQFSCRESSTHLGVCEILQGCTAIRRDGSISTFTNNQCDRPCPEIPLKWNLEARTINLTEATYVRMEDQLICYEKSSGDTQLVCGWI